MRPCVTCNGSGRVWARGPEERGAMKISKGVWMKTCPDCGGSGSKSNSPSADAKKTLVDDFKKLRNSN